MMLSIWYIYQYDDVISGRQVFFRERDKWMYASYGQSVCVYTYIHTHTLAANAAAGRMSQEINPFIVSDGCSSGVLAENIPIWLYRYTSDSFT